MDFGGPQQEQQYKQFIIALLGRQANVDGNIAKNELAFILGVAESMGLTYEDIEPILQNPQAYEMDPPAEERLRMQVLYYLLFMMRADGDISAKEEEMCYEVGFKLGFRMEMVQNLIGLMRQFLRRKLPPDAMLEEIKPFLN